MPDVLQVFRSGSTLHWRHSASASKKP